MVSYVGDAVVVVVVVDRLRPRCRYSECGRGSGCPWAGVQVVVAVVLEVVVVVVAVWLLVMFVGVVLIVI